MNKQPVHIITYISIYIYVVTDTTHSSNDP